MAWAISMCLLKVDVTSISLATQHNTFGTFSNLKGLTPVFEINR